MIKCFDIITMKKLILILIFIGLWQYGNSQPYNTYKLTLQKAIQIALENNLDLQILKNNLESSIINNSLTVAGGMPEVTASANNTRTLTNLNQELSNGTKIQRNNITNNSIGANITGNYTLYNGMRVRYTHSRLMGVQKQNEILINARVQNLIAGVMTQYYDIVRQQGYIKTIEEALKVTLLRKNIIELKQLVGLANNADRYQVLLDSTAAIQDILTQKNIITQAKADFMNLLVQKPDSVFVIADTIIIDSSIQFDSIKNRLKYNPDLLLADQQIKINELLVKEIGTQRYPSVVASGGYNYTRNKNGAGFTLLNQTSGPFIGLGINVPLFNGGLFKKQLSIANINIQNASLTSQQTVNNLQTQLVKTFNAYKNNLEQLKIEKDNNKTAAALLDIVYKRYELGVGTIIDVRIAQQSYLDAGFRLLNISYAAKIAEIELKRLASILP